MGGRRVVISTDQASRIGELLEEAGLPASAVAELREPPAPGAIGLVHGSLSGGFVHEPLGLVVLTDRELFGATRIRRLAPSKRVVTRDLVGKLEPGDLLVHIDHGIARYAGMTQREYGGDVKEYLQLDFAGEDKIFLPADQIGRISRYSVAPGPPSASWAALTGSAPSDGSAERWPSWRRSCWRSTPPGSRRRASASRRTLSGSASWKRHSPTARHPTSSAPSRRSRATCSAAGRWIGWSAATSAMARPRSRCAPPSRPCRTASRWPCWCRPPSWRSSTLAPSERRLGSFPVEVEMLSRFVGEAAAGEDRGERRRTARSTC